MKKGESQERVTIRPVFTLMMLHLCLDNSSPLGRSLEICIVIIIDLETVTTREVYRGTQLNSKMNSCENVFYSILITQFFSFCFLFRFLVKKLQE